MIRLLDADALIATLKRQAYSGQWSEEVIFGYESSIRLIERLANECAKTEYKRRRGEWITYEQDYHYANCSVCDFTITKEEKEEFNFCPHCGSDMRKEGE